MFALEDLGCVDLVGDDPYIVTPCNVGNCLQFPARENCPGRVIGIGKYDGLCFISNSRLNQYRLGTETGFTGAGNTDNPCTINLETGLKVSWCEVRLSRSRFDAGNHKQIVA